ncbi:MAG: methyltransferase [Candidatus Izemoplasmatales bacterium]|jgi:16S rRNA (guanine1207-N2)-methyltransferase|nr:methyltransferase [Candidatus Izemoplasmatales bacterium]
MDHYFTKDNDNLKTNEKEIYVQIEKEKFSFLTDHGVFSKQGLDFGSRLLIESIKDIKSKNFLDMGCGYGPLGIIYKRFNPESSVLMVDINERAIKLSEKNKKINRVDLNVIASDGFEKIKEIFDLIISNPPIRAGKAVIYKMFADSYEHLSESGIFVYVINKKHGAPSAIKKCEEIFSKVTVINKKSGYYIIKCIK